MKCEICKKNIQTTFLKKLIGTIVKNDKGKKLGVCFECQKKFNSKKEIIEAMK
tara:strand:- start:268 stop:426 length:159 start_codon:yes stop_codon:yes gene_type:complete